MPPPHPPEFPQRAVELARQGPAPVSKIAKDLGISDSCLRNWMHQADAEENAASGGSGGDKKELAELRRRNRQLELENDILKRAAAYFARENVLPKYLSRWSANSPTTVSPSRWPAGCCAYRGQGSMAGSAVPSRRGNCAIRRCRK